MSDTKRSFIEKIKNTLWFSIQLEDIQFVNDNLQELTIEDKSEVEKIYTRKINNLVGSIIEYANTRNGGRNAVVEAKNELARLMQLNLTIFYSKENTPNLFDRNIKNNDDIQSFIKNAYESDKCIAYYA